MKMMSRALVVSVLVLGIIGAAYAQFSRPEDAIRYRQAVMVLIAQHFDRIAAVVQEQTPYDSGMVGQDAALVETLSKLPWEAFSVPGTDKGQTSLKSNAFSEPDRFKQAADEFETTSSALASAAKKGGLDDLKAPFGSVAQSCKGCHREFRSQ